MPTLEQYLYPTTANRPAAHSLFIAHGTHAHKFRRWRELAGHDVRNPITFGKLERIFKHYPLTQGTPLEPIRLSETHFVRLLHPLRRVSLLPLDYLTYTGPDRPAPYPRWMMIDPQVRVVAVKEAAKAGYGYIRLLNYIHTAHHKMLFDASADPALIHMALRNARDTASPHAYLSDRYLPTSFTALLEPVPV